MGFALYQAQLASMRQTKSHGDVIMARGNGECDGEFCARVTHLSVAPANGLTGARNCLSGRIPRSLVPPEHRF